MENKAIENPEANDPTQTEVQPNQEAQSAQRSKLEPTVKFIMAVKYQRAFVCFILLDFPLTSPKEFHLDFFVYLHRSNISLVLSNQKFSPEWKKFMGPYSFQANEYDCPSCTSRTYHPMHILSRWKQN